MPEARHDGSVLTINGGSSSLRFALFDGGLPPVRYSGGKIERIGLSESRLTVSRPAGPSETRVVEAETHAAAARVLINWLQQQEHLPAIGAIGHRIVHGGLCYTSPERITEELLAEMSQLIAFAPDHMPAEIALVDELRREFPGLPQFACFDTAFHHALPRVAQRLPVPRRLEAMGVRRYGFHGLSYTFLLQELSRVAGPEAAHGRVILAHLGNGASMAAVSGGQCIDTSMAFTPASGLPMGTRSGDLDPGLFWFLLREANMSPQQFNHMVHHESGLLGISETSSDMRDLLQHEADDVRAAEAIALFCYHARKWIGSFAAALGGLDTLVFSGGIGEQAPLIRSRICDGLGFLGIALDGIKNVADASVISTDSGRVTVRVIPADEERVIAEAVAASLRTTSVSETAQGHQFS